MGSCYKGQVFGKWEILPSIFVRPCSSTPLNVSGQVYQGLYLQYLFYNFYNIEIWEALTATFFMYDIHSNCDPSITIFVPYHPCPLKSSGRNGCQQMWICARSRGCMRVVLVFYFQTKLETMQLHDITKCGTETHKSRERVMVLSQEWFLKVFAPISKKIDCYL